MAQKVSFQNLSPLSFLDRSTFVYPNKVAITYGDQKYTYAQFYERVKRHAGRIETGRCREGGQGRVLSA